MTAATPPYRISGHESFPCRYTRLPKAVRGLDDNRRHFSDEALCGYETTKNSVATG
jgi:hypothetical protein